MKSIELLSLTLENFKGIRELSIAFNKETSIYGENATGKTTLFDAFKWVLFGKDSSDRADFEIKTLTSDNKVLHGLDHTITAILSIDGIKKTIQKTFREKWTKKRGEATEVLTGNETLHYINDVPYSQSDFKKQINELCEENLFKLLTDPLYFTQSLKWQERRKLLMQVCGDVPVFSVIASKPELKDLVELFQQESEIENIRKMLASRKKKLNDEIKNIPPRIDECTKSIYDYDFKTMQENLTHGEKELDEIDQLILSHVKTDPARTEKENNYRSLTQEINRLKFNADNTSNQHYNSLKSELRSKESQLAGIESLVRRNEQQILSLEAKKRLLESDIEECREEWNKEQSAEIHIDEQFICPTCNRLLDAQDIDQKKAEMRGNFNIQKVKNLSKLEAQGKHFKIDLLSTINDIESLIKQNEDHISAALILKREIHELSEAVSAMPVIEYGSLYDELVHNATLLQKELFETPDNKESAVIASELTSRKKVIQESIENLKKMLRVKDTNRAMSGRIQELETQERKLAGQIAELEGQEYLCETFIRTKVSMLEDNINSKFRFVNFKLFEDQINGGLQETCEPLINGVPFADANHAAKINAGIDIINTLSDHFKITAPIFIDNREAVNNLIDTNAQTINLIVSNDKKLTVRTLADSEKKITKVA